jgi:hypothetical protein
MTVPITVTWALASLAIIVSGGFLISSERARATKRNYWGPGGFFLIVMLLSFAGWIFVICKFLARQIWPRGFRSCPSNQKYWSHGCFPKQG